MKKLILLLPVLLAACYRQSAIPLGNDMMEIDISAAPVYGRSGAMDMAINKAASATIEAGYDKFIIINNNGWSEMIASGTSYGSFSGNQGSASGAYGSGFSVMQKPEVKMIIHMYHNSDKGAEKAVDAHSIIKP